MTINYRKILDLIYQRERLSVLWIQSRRTFKRGWMSQRKWQRTNREQSIQAGWM